MGIKTLRPIRENPADYDAIEAYIARLFKETLYLPLLAELKASPRKVLKNAYESLGDAILYGRIIYSKGVFTGKFTSQVSKELKELGAKWDKGTWKIPQSKLPFNVRSAISQSEARFVETLKKIDKKLAQVIPDEIADKFKAEKLFDRTLWHTDLDFKKAAKNLIVTPELSDVARARIAEKYTDSLKLPIRGWVKDQVAKLRKDMKANFEKGQRFEGMIDVIQKSYGSSLKKAKFLARQETMLMMTSFKEARYADAGITEYKWRCVTGTPAHPVRPMHKALNDRSLKGEIFKFKEPPVDDPNGSRHNPGENFNCFPGSVLATLDRPIDKIFRRTFSGELSLIITDDDMIFESTGNHPVLTNRGWVSAQSVKVGDYLFNSQIEDRFGEKVDGQQMVSSFEDLFSALGLCIEIMKASVSPSDFHGDVSDDKVDIISFERELFLKRIIALFESLGEFLFATSNSPSFSLRPIPQSLIAWGLTPKTVMGFFGELKEFIRSHTSESERVSFASGPGLDLLSLCPTPYNISADGVFTRHRQLTHPVLVILDRFLDGFKFIARQTPGSIELDTFSPDELAKKALVHADNLGNLGHGFLGGLVNPARVIDKSFRSFSGHIYNFETLNGWYFANNKIVQNCRCVAIPIVKFKDKK